MALILVATLLDSCSSCDRKGKPDPESAAGFSVLDVQPIAARAGDRLTITIAIRHAASGIPVVEVDGRGAELEAQTTSGVGQGSHYVFVYAVSGDESEGRMAVLARYTDAQGKEFSAVTTVLFDFTPPEIEIIGLFAGPVNGRCGVPWPESAKSTLEFKLDDSAGKVREVRVHGKDASFVHHAGPYFGVESPVAIPDAEALLNWPMEVPVRIVASDGVGNEAVFDGPVSAEGRPDFCVQLESPKPAEEYTGAVPLAALVEPDLKASFVSFFSEEMAAAERVGRPFNAQWKVSAESLGERAISVLAFDSRGLWLADRARVVLNPELPVESPLGPGVVQAVKAVDMETGPISPKGKVGSQGKIVRSVAVDPAGGAVWIGTAGGLSRFDGSGFRGYGREDGLGMTAINDVAVGADGRVFVAGHGGLAVYDGATWRSFDDSRGLPSHVAYSVAVAPDGSAWIGTYSGLAVLSSDGSHISATYTGANGLPNSTVLSVTVTHNADGTGYAVWAGTEKGVARATVENLESVNFGLVPEVPSVPVWAIERAPDGSMWIGTAGRGVTILSRESETVAWDVRNLTAMDGLADDTVWSIAFEPTTADRPSPTAYIAWLGTSHGTSKWDGNAFSNFTPVDGLLDWMVYSIAFDPWGGRWFGTPRGVTRIGG